MPEQPTSPVAEDKQDSDELSLNASADGGDIPTQPRPNQPRTQLRAAIRAVYRAPKAPATSEAEEEETPGQSSIADPAEKVPESPEPTAELTLPEEFQPVEENQPEDELTKAAQAQALIAKGQVQARQGQLELARKLFGQAVQKDPANAEAWTWLGGLLADINLERAKECLSRAVELDATNERANRGLAQVNHRLEEQAQERAIVLVRQEIKVGLEEIIDKQRQSGIEPDPESIPLGGARLRPAIERGELKPYKTRRSRLSPLSLVVGFVVLAVVVGVLVWLGPLNRGQSEGQPTALASGSPITSAVFAPGSSTDETFALNMRLEIEKYNKFFLTAHDLRQQIQANQIGWDDYQQAVKKLQLDIKNEKKPLDNLSLSATAKLIQLYRELQAIAGVTNQAIDFTVSGIDNVSPEDLEEGNRQFNTAASRLTELLRLLNLQMPLPAPSNITPGPTLPVSPATTPPQTTVGTPTPTP